MKDSIDRVIMSDMKIKLLQRRIDDIVNFLKPFLPQANSHMVEFLAADLWNEFIPKSIIQEVQTQGELDAINTFWDHRNKFQKSSQHDQCETLYSVTGAQNKFKNLINFIDETEKHYLKLDDVLCLGVNQLKDRLNSLGATSVESLKLTEFMSDKKSHEVEVLSNIVATLASWTGAEYTVELGGGQGYLCNMLNMFYKMQVLNVDRCQLKERGAQERNRKIQKQWPGLVKKARKTVSSSETSFENDSELSSAPKFGNNNNNRNNSTESDSFSMTVDSTMDRIKDLSLVDVKAEMTQKCYSDSYRHVTEFITQDTDIVELVKDSFGCPEDVHVCLTGLHTCGDLGSTSLKLYTRSPLAVALCTVPCCYHLLTEHTDEEFLSETPEVLDGDTAAGFPMSNYLKDFSLGRNARMLASQSIDKYTVSNDVPSLSLYYRALLEVLLKKYSNGNAIGDGKMKKIASKCSNFSQYVNAAIKKLKIQTDMIPLNDLELNSFDELHRNDNIHKLTLYYLLRLCLAQVVESLILLDRLMYLSENGFSDGPKDSVLVKMFDPVVSPRCHAIVSYRKR